MNWFVATGVLTTVCFVVISLQAKAGATYRYSFIFLSLLLWLVFFLRRKLSLHPFHFALFALAMLLHNLGAFGWYRKSFLGLDFDSYVHAWFGFVAALILYRCFTTQLFLPRWGYWAAVLAFVLGIGALHELMEWSTNVFLGDKHGMLKPEITGPFDTQKDLGNNLLGALAALILYSILGKVPSPPAPGDVSKPGVRR